MKSAIKSKNRKNKQKNYVKNLAETKLGVPRKYLPKNISELEKKSMTEEQESHLTMLKFNNFLDAENSKKINFEDR